MSSTVAFATPPDLDREFVLKRCTYFAGVKLWPTVGEGLDPVGWLSNFEAGEERHALYLLNAYLYFPERIIDRVFTDAFQGLSHAASPDTGPWPPSEWRRFVESILIVPVRGERPSPADSGTLFVRRARRLFAIGEDRLVEPADAVARLESSPDTPILFVDDFVGTGNQFATTWTNSDSGRRASFQSLASTGAGRYYYCPVVATAYGVNKIRVACPEVTVRPGHLLPDRYSVFADDSLIWPSDLRGSAEAFIRSASERAGIPMVPGHVRFWKGFHELGLALAFEHGTPDATIPLFDWHENGWIPLWNR